MNERIRGLAEQARQEFLKMPTGYTPEQVGMYPQLMEKFAELLIQQCMACSTWVGKNNTNLVEPVHTAHAINQRIKQQFGVEE